MKSEAQSKSLNWETLAEAANYRPTELAARCSVSLRTLQRHFRKEYNLTISSWLRTARLNRAYAKVVAGEAIKAVAFDLGYKQLSHFSRDFKQQFGVPPRMLAGEKQGGTGVSLVSTQQTAISAL